MIIDVEVLEVEKGKLKNDFDKVKDSIQKAEIEIGSMKSNLNALFGAIQQTDRLLEKVRGGKDEKKPMPAEKEKALNIATT